MGVVLGTGVLSRPRAVEKPCRGVEQKTAKWTCVRVAWVSDPWGFRGYSYRVDESADAGSYLLSKNPSGVLKRSSNERNGEGYVLSLGHIRRFSTLQESLATEGERAGPRPIRETYHLKGKGTLRPFYLFLLEWGGIREVHDWAKILRLRGYRWGVVRGKRSNKRQVSTHLLGRVSEFHW
jgi:hypothetical protein